MPEGFVPVSAPRVAVAGIFSRPDPPGRNCCRDSIVSQNPGWLGSWSSHQLACNFILPKLY